MILDGKLSDIKHISTVIDEEIKYIQGRYDGSIKSLLTPFNKYNMASMNGIEFGTIHCCAGLSGSGKTLFLSQMESGLIELNKDVDFDILNLNFEMLSRRLIGRKISSEINKSIKSLYNASDEKLTNEDVKHLNEYLNSLKNANIFYLDITKNINELYSIIIEWYNKRMLKNPTKKLVITLDHTVLVKKLPGKNQVDTLYELMEMFNLLKKQIPDKIAFIFLSQLNRTIESSDRIAPDRNKLHLMYPVKADLFGSDAVYQYSDIVMVSHMPYKLGIQEYGPERIICDKNDIFHHYIKVRDGEPIIARMKANFKHMRMEEYNYE